MFEINFSTCTMRDVIARSATCHPTLFREAMLAAAQAHRAAQQVAPRRVASIALGMESDLRRMADDIDMDNFDASVLSPAETVQAFNIARKLQCVTWDVAESIAKRG